MAPPLLWPLHSKSIPASSRKSRSPKSTSPWYFDEPVLVMISIRPSRTRELGRVRIVVDSDFLDFRRAKVVLGARQSVNDDGWTSDPTDAGLAIGQRAHHIPSSTADFPGLRDEGVSRRGFSLGSY